MTINTGAEPLPFTSSQRNLQSQAPYSIEIKTSSPDPRTKWAEIATMPYIEEALEFGENLLTGFRNTVLRPQLRVVEKYTGTIIGGWGIDAQEIHPDWRESRSNHVG